MTALSLALCSCSGRAGFTRLGDDYVCATCRRPRPGYEENTVGLAYFRSGPMDGKAYEVSTLLKLESLALPTMEYRWTPEKITSSLTGRTARVWVWDGPGTGGNTAVENEHQEAHSMTENTTVADAPTHTSLLARRQALKLSRPQVAAKAGVTAAQISSLETSAKRIKTDVLNAVHEALLHFEREADVASASDDKEGHASS